MVCSDAKGLAVLSKVQLALFQDAEFVQTVRVESPMAKMYPPRFTHSDDRMRNAEKRFYNACKDQLNDDWTVLYEVKWFGRRNQGNERGDADFLLMHSQMGIFCVEVKGGQEIFVENNEWFTVPHGITERQKIRDPFGQTADSKSVLWNFVREFAPSVKLAGAFGHFVVFPGAEIAGDVSLTARRSLICDKKDLVNLPETILRISNTFGQRTKLSEADIQCIRKVILPDVMLLTQGQSSLNEAEDSIERLTSQQLLAFEMLRNLKEFVVTGGAGTGKTVLAFNRAQALASQGARTLFLCHSGACAAHLRSLVDPRNMANLEIYSSGEFISDVMQSPESTKLFFESGNLDAISSDFLGVALQNSLFYDALIVDEAQNIPLNLIELLTTFLPNSGERYIYIFGDVHQNTLRVQNNALEFPFQIESIVLDINCRSSEEITAAASAIFNETGRSNGLSGPKPILALTVSGEPLRVYSESGPSAPVAIAAKYLIETVGLKAENVKYIVADWTRPDIGVGVWKTQPSLVINPETWNCETKIAEVHKDNPTFKEIFEKQIQQIESGHYLIKSIALPDIQGLEADGVIIGLNNIAAGLPLPRSRADAEHYLVMEARMWLAEIVQQLSESSDGQLSADILDVSKMSDSRRELLELFKTVLYSAITRARYAVVFLGNSVPLAFVKLLLAENLEAIRFENDDSSPTMHHHFSEKINELAKQLRTLRNSNGTVEEIAAVTSAIDKLTEHFLQE